MIDRPLFLLGFMGAGKTTIGRGLARRAGRPFLDLDRVIEERSGATIPEIFAAGGEDRFRELESEALRAVELAEQPIVATGGGVVERSENMEYVARHGATLFLRVPFDTLVERVARSRTERPLFTDPERARALWEARLPRYRAAEFELLIGGSEPIGAVVERAWNLLRGTPPCGC